MDDSLIVPSSPSQCRKLFSYRGMVTETISLPLGWFKIDDLLLAFGLGGDLRIGDEIILRNFVAAPLRTILHRLGVESVDDTICFMPGDSSTIQHPGRASRVEGQSVHENLFIVVLAIQLAIKFEAIALLELLGDFWTRVLSEIGFMEWILGLVEPLWNEYRDKIRSVSVRSLGMEPQDAILHKLVRLLGTIPGKSSWFKDKYHLEGICSVVHGMVPLLKQISFINTDNVVLVGSLDLQNDGFCLRDDTGSIKIWFESPLLQTGYLDGLYCVPRFVVRDPGIRIAWDDFVPLAPNPFGKINGIGILVLVHQVTQARNLVIVGGIDPEQRMMDRSIDHRYLPMIHTGHLYIFLDAKLNRHPFLFIPQKSLENLDQMVFPFEKTIGQLCEDAGIDMDETILSRWRQAVDSYRKRDKPKPVHQVAQVPSAEQISLFGWIHRCKSDRIVVADEDRLNFVEIRVDDPDHIKQIRALHQLELDWILARDVTVRNQNPAILEGGSRFHGFLSEPKACDQVEHPVMAQSFELCRYIIEYYESEHLNPRIVEYIKVRIVSVENLVLIPNRFSGSERVLVDLSLAVTDDTAEALVRVGNLQLAAQLLGLDSKGCDQLLGKCGDRTDPMQMDVNMDFDPREIWKLAVFPVATDRSDGFLGDRQTLYKNIFTRRMKIGRANVYTLCHKRKMFQVVRVERPNLQEEFFRLTLA